jgi:hypothetical protein
MPPKRPRNEIKVIAELDQLVSRLEHQDPGAEEEARSFLRRLARRANLGCLMEIYQAIADWFSR